MICKSIENFLRRSTPADIVEFLTQESDEVEGCASMRWLLAHQRQKAYEALCLLYDVAVYQVGSTCFANNALPGEMDYWFVAVRSDADWDAEHIPLCETKELAYATATASLKLEQLFFCGGNKAPITYEAALVGS